MTKKDIIRMISEELGLSQLQTSRIVHDLFDAIVNTVVKNGRVDSATSASSRCRWERLGKLATRVPEKRSWSPSDVPSLSSLGGR